MSHLRSVGVSLPNDILEHIDSVRGSLNRSTAIRAILTEWHQDNRDLPEITHQRRKNRWYGMDTGNESHVIRALESRVALSAWIAEKPQHRQQITMKTKPDWASVEYLHALPTHDIDID